jgi:hypothetical protein
MPIARFQMPDGRIARFEVPEGTSPEEAQSLVQQELQQESKPVESTEPVTPDYTTGEAFKKALVRGGKQLSSAFGDVIPAMGASALGFDEYAKRQMEEAAETQREIAARYRPEVESYKDVKDLGSAGTYFVETLGEQLPNLLTSLVPGGIGGAIARRGAVAAAETAAKNTGLSGLEALTGEAAKEAGKQITSKTALGQNIGLALGSYAQNAPEVFENIYNQTGELRPGVSLLWGAGSAALDSVLPATILNKLTPAAKVGVVEKVLEKSGADKSLLRSFSKEILKGMGYEGVTEGAQELISESAEKFVAGNPQIFGSEDWDRVMESAVRGAVAGGAFGSISGAADYRQSARAQEEEQTRKDLEALKQQQEQSKYYQQYTKQDVLPLASSIEQAKEAQQQATAQGDLFAGSGATAAPITPTQETLEPKVYTEQDVLPLSSPISSAQGDLFADNAPPQEPAKSLVITPEILTKQLGIGHTGKPYKKILGLDAYDLNQNKIIQRNLQDHFEKYGPKTEKAKEVESFMNQLKKIETEITPKGRTEDGTTTQGLESTRTGTSDAVSVRQQAGVAEGAGEPLGTTMAFGTTDTGTALGGEQGVATSLIESVEENGKAKHTPEELELYGVKEPDINILNNHLNTLKKLYDEYVPLLKKIKNLKKPRREDKGNLEQLERLIQYRGLDMRKDAHDVFSMTKLGNYIDSFTGVPYDEKRWNKLTDYIKELNSRTKTKPEAKPVTKKELQQAQGAAQVAISNEPVGDTFDALSSTISYNELSSKLKREVRALKNKNQLNQEAADTIVKMHRNELAEKVAKKVNLPEKGLFEEESKAERKEKEARMEQEGAFESTVLPEDIELSTFQKQFSEDKTVGQALKRLLKQKKSKNFPGLNIPQKILVNALLKIPGIAEMNFGVFKHPDSRRGNKLQRYEEIRAIVGERQVPKTTPIKDANGRVIGESDIFYETEPIYGGEYDEKTNIVKLYQSSTVNTLLHEVVHAATVKVLKNNIINGVGVTPLGKKIMRIYNAAQEAADVKSKRYGLENVYEFIAEAFTNPDFQNFLANQPSIIGAKPSLRSKLTSLFNDLFSAIKDMLGVPKAAESLLADVFDLSSPLFKGPNVELTAAAKVAADLAMEPTSHYSMTMPASDTAASIDLMNSPGLTYAQLPTFDDGIVNKGKDFISKLPAFARGIFLGFTSLGDMHELYGNIMPSIKTLDTVLKLRNNTHRILKDKIDHVANKALKALKGKSPGVVKQFNLVAHELSRLNIDPRDKANNNHPLVQAWNALPEELRKAGTDIVESYEDYRDQLIKFLVGDDETTPRAKAIREKFEDKKLPFYLPLLRQGNYWIQFTDNNNETVSLAYDNPRQQKMMFEDLQKKGAKDLRAFSRIDQITRKSAPPVGFMSDIVKILEENKVDSGVIDRAYQTYISLFPAESIRQQFRERQGILGYTGDVVQGYATVAPKMATQISNLQHGAAIDKAYSDVEIEAKNASTDVAASVMGEISKRRDFFSNPVASSWVYGASNVNFFWSIAGNISSALVNLTILPTVVFPQLAINPVTGQYEYGKAFDALNEARSLFFKGGKDKSREFLPIRTFGENPNLPDDLKALHEQAIKMGVIQYSVGRDLADIRKVSSDKYSDFSHKMNTTLGYMFEGTERFNREVTLVAAYKLAKASGMDPNAAIDHAIRFTSKIHSEAVPEAGARYLQAGLPKVALIFKRFAMAQIFNLYTLFNAAKNGLNPMERKVARRQIIGIYGMTFLLAGLQGVPLYGALQVLANVLCSDDDEPYDFDEEIRESFGMLGYKGPTNLLFGVDIASRTGFNGMIWRDDPKRLAEVGYTSYFIEHFLGPTFSTGKMVLQDGPAMMANGQYERGLEKMMPSFVKNPLKAMRFATEGAKNPNGAPLVDDVSGYNQFMQIFGFTPANVSEAYAKAGAMKQADKKLMDRRDGLLDAMYLARTNGDTDAQARIYEKIARFNEANPEPGYVIKQSTVNRSMKARDQALGQSVYGVHFDRKKLAKLQEEYGN